MIWPAVVLHYNQESAFLIIDYTDSGLTQGFKGLLSATTIPVSDVHWRYSSQYSCSAFEPSKAATWLTAAISGENDMIRIGSVNDMVSESVSLLLGLSVWWLV